MKRKLLAALLTGALGLVPAAAMAQAKAEAKPDCAAAEKKAAECSAAKSTTAECKKATDLMAGACKPKKKEKKGGC
jgi:hypothetical protein